MTKWRTIIWRRMRLGGIFSTAVFLMLAVFTSILTLSEGNRRSVENVESMKNGNDVSAISTGPKIRSTDVDRSLSLAENRADNSPALNSFLENVLRAKDELKWIDQAVRRVGKKETREKVPSRFLRASLRPVSRYHTKVRFKRRSSHQLDDEESWPSSKRKYNYDDDEIKVKRYASRSPTFHEQRLYGNREEGSAVDDGEPVDDSSLKHWAKEEGLQVPEGWLNSGQTYPVDDNWSSRNSANSRRENRKSNEIDDFSKSMNNWVENPARGERDAVYKPSIRSLEKEDTEKRPTLESLRKTVLELRRSLEDSDEKVDRIYEQGRLSGVAKNGERDVQIQGNKNDDKNQRNKKQSNSGYEENDREYEHEPSSSKMSDLSPESNWWDDPRSAADMFDFRRRDGDEEDDENDDDYSEPVDSDFEAMMRRVKREEDDDDDGKEAKDRIRVYRRAGFGESYRENNLEKGISKAGEIYGEIKEPVSDKIINDGNFDDVKKAESKISAVKVNEEKNEEEIKNMGYDNPVKKYSPSTTTNLENVREEKATGTIGDSNLEDTKKLGFLSGDEKRSLSLRGAREQEQQANPNTIKFAPLDEILKISATEPLAKDNSDEKREVEKSDPNNDDVHKLSNDSNDVKKHEEQEKKNHVDGSNESREDSIGTQKADKIKDGIENEDKLKPRELNNSVDNIDSGKNLEAKSETEKSGVENETKDQFSETVDLAELKQEITKLHSNGDKIQSEDHEDSKRGNEVTSNSTESVAKLENKSATVDKNVEELDANLDTKDTKRKLLWVADKSKTVKIRGTDNSPSRRLLKKRNAVRSMKKESVSDTRDDSDVSSNDKSEQVKKRSARLSYPENFEEDKEDSRRKLVERKIESEVSENEYDADNNEDDEVAKNDEDFRDNDEGEENQSVETDEQPQSSPMRLLSHLDKDRDPMRDRINILIKQKLNDREKGKSTNVKREANYPVAESIQYYDYEDDVNLGDSSDESKIADNDNQQIPAPKNITSLESVSIDGSPPESITKKDENAEDEKKQELEQSEHNTNPPKQEFISDVDLDKLEKKNGSQSIAEEMEPNNEEREIEATKSNNRWLAEPEEAEEDSKSRYQYVGDSDDREKNAENEKSEILEEPLEYSVKVHGKLDPESMDDMVYDKSNFKDKEARENEKRSDKIETADSEDSQYEKLISRSRPQGDERIEDEEFDRDQALARSSSGRNWRYRDSARIEEGNNDRSLSQNSYSHDIEEEDVTSRGARLNEEESDQDSLPTMLDRSESRSPSSGERTYLVIAPTKLKISKKPNLENSSTTSGSNYLALKLTDDLFKGGIEQSNPIDDVNVENNLMRETTTEWKVINMGDNARPRVNYLSNDVKLTRDKNLAINPRDVVHESIVDPEEMAADFDDDTRPRFGRDLKYVREPHRHFSRSLQSVSYAVDNMERVHSKVDINNGEKPVDKYLENGQKEFGHSSEDEEAVKLIREKNEADEQNSTNTVNTKNFDKRSSQGNETFNNETKMEKDERGSTNVEEWEISAPTVRKQGLITVRKNSQDPLRDPSEMTNVEMESSSKIFPNIYDGASHERESRSVKIGNENSKSYEKESKNRRKVESESKFNGFSNYDDLSPWEKNSRSRYEEEGIGGRKNSRAAHDSERFKTDSRIEERHGRDHKSAKSHRRSNSKKHDNAVSDTEEKLRSHGNRKSAKYSNDSKTSSKNVKRHKERNFKDSPRNPITQKAKSHDKITPDIMGHPHSMLHSKSFETGKGYDEANAPEGDEKKISNENTTENPAKVIPELEDPQKKKFTVLLAADNMEDESQMDLALHGELAGKIVERIFDQVQKNDALNIALGPGLYRKHKSEDAVESDRIYRQGLDEDEVKHTEGMMRRVMELLGRLILDEVQRKTCASLPPDMREFLQWMLGVDDDDRPTDQAPPLPLVHDQDLPNHRPDDKFLFEGPSSRHIYENHANADVEELHKKLRIIKSLISEYNTLTEQEKTKVQSVYDYLEKQLSLLLKYIETKEAEGNRNDVGASPGGGNILQYQNAASNANGSALSEPTLPPLVNTPSILMLSNASFIEHPRATNHFPRFRRHGMRGELEEGEEVETKKHKKRKHKNQKNEDSEKHQIKHGHGKKKKNKNHHHHHETRKRTQSPEYKKLIRSAAMLRKKRANLYEDNWDPVDSGYEVPTIYNSNGEIRKKRKKSFWKNGFDSLQETDNPHSFQLLDDEELGRNNNEASKYWNSANKRDLINTENQTKDKIKRDVLSTSIALQPWLNPKPDDLVSSDYLKELTNELVRGSRVPPVYPGGQVNEKEKREVAADEGQTEETESRTRSIADDEVILLNKREAWKTQNEQQLEEVAFGKDMRGKWKEKEQFEKLTGIDRKKNTDDDNTRKKRAGDKSDSTFNTRVDVDTEKSDDSKTVADKIQQSDKIYPANETSSEKFESKNETLKNLNPVESESKLMSQGKPELFNDEQSVSNEMKKDFERAIEKSETKNRVSAEQNVDKTESDVSESNKNAEKRDVDKKHGIVEGSAILPLLEVSEQREQQKQASKTENDDQRDIADQILGYETPFIAGLNTY